MVIAEIFQTNVLRSVDETHFPESPLHWQKRRKTSETSSDPSQPQSNLSSKRKPPFSHFFKHKIIILYPKDSCSLRKQTILRTNRIQLWKVQLNRVAEVDQYRSPSKQSKFWDTFIPVSNCSSRCSQIEPRGPITYWSSTTEMINFLRGQ